MTSLRSDWATPRKLFEWLDREFHFELDACANAGNAALTTFFTHGSLDKPWAKRTWCNPPYGRGMGLWILKAVEESRRGNTTVMLLPARTDTSWWHEYILPNAELRFLRGRLNFDDGGGRAPFPSVIAVFRPKGDRTA